jgi:hypothetical protein
VVAVAFGFGKDDLTVRLRYLIESDTRGADEAAAATAKTRKETTKLGEESKKTSKETAALDKQIAELKAHIVELGKAYAETGDKSIFKEIAKDRAAIRNVEKIKGELDEAARAATKAGGAGAAFVAELGKDFAALGDVAGPLKGALIGGAVAAAAEVAPFVLAAVGGAVATAVGTVGIAAGLAAATKDPAVKSALHDFGTELSAEVAAIGAPFVRPFLDSLKILSKDLKGLRLSDVFADAAPAATGLAHTLGDFVTKLMPGFDRALQRSGPYMDQLDRGLSNVGASLGGFLDEVSGSPANLQAFRQALDLLAAGITLTGKAVAFAAYTFDYLGEKWAGFYRRLANVTILLPGLHEQFASIADRLDAYNRIGGTAITTTDLFGATVDDTTHAVQSLGTADLNAATATGALSVALSKGQTNFLNYMGAAVNAEQAVDDFAAGVKEHGRSLNIDTQAGRDNVRALEDLARAAADAAQKKFDETGSLKSAQDEYEKYRKKLMDTLLAMGYTKKAAQDLVNQWLGMDGLTATLKINLKVMQSKSPEASDFANNLASGIANGRSTQHRAGGGGVMAGQDYAINERAGERVTFPANGMVHPANLSPVGGGGTPIVISFAATGDRLLDAILRELKSYIRINGGTGPTSVQTALSY